MKDGTGHEDFSDELRGHRFALESAEENGSATSRHVLHALVIEVFTLADPRELFNKLGEVQNAIDSWRENLIHRMAVAKELGIQPAFVLDANPLELDPACGMTVEAALEHFESIRPEAEPTDEECAATVADALTPAALGVETTVHRIVPIASHDATGSPIEESLHHACAIMADEGNPHHDAPEAHAPIALMPEGWNENTPNGPYEGA